MRLYSRECEGYIDKNEKQLVDETSIKHLTDGEQPVDIDTEIEIYDENDNYDNIQYENYYYDMNHNKYDLCKMNKQIRTKKFICGASIIFGKWTTIRKWISVHKDSKFMIIVPTINIDEEFYIKLINKLMRMH